MNNREIAIMANRPTYQGRACAYGHVIRNTTNGRCTECQKMTLAISSSTKRYIQFEKEAKAKVDALTAKKKAKAAADYKKWSSKNKDKIHAKVAKWFKDNRERRTEYMKEYYLRTGKRTISPELAAKSNIHL